MSFGDQDRSRRPAYIARVASRDPGEIPAKPISGPPRIMCCHAPPTRVRKALLAASPVPQPGQHQDKSRLLPLQTRPPAARVSLDPRFFPRPGRGVDVRPDATAALPDPRIAH